MNPFNDYYFLGKIIRPHGFDGKVNAYLDTDDPGYYLDLDMVFLNMNNSPVPFFVEFINLKGNKATLKFQDIDNLLAAESLTQKEMYLPLKSLPPLSENKFYYHEIEGFSVVDNHHGKLGVVKGVLEYPSQAVIQVMVNEKEVLIPINEKIIRSVDKKSREITIETPEGLLDIYLA
ncbi:MAG: ribosome maturation factor RimM [bacterium]